MRRFAWCAVTLLLIAVSAHARTWTDSTGTYKTEAELVDFQNGIVRLKKVDGTIVSLPIERLSQADQQFVRSQDANAASTEGPKTASNRNLRLGEWVDLLPWVELNKDCLGPGGERVPGEGWKRVGTSLRSPGGLMPMLTVPITIQGDYDLEIDFTRFSKQIGGSGFTIHVPGGDYQFSFLLFEGKDSTSGGQLHCIAGVAYYINGKTIHKVIPPEDFIGKRATLGISVRRKQGAVALQTTYNGQPLVEWSLDEQTLRSPQVERFVKSLERRLKILKLVGINMEFNNVEVEFHSIKVKLVSGTASHPRPE